jgi:hypothetical protein
LPLDKVVFNTEAHAFPRFELGKLFYTGWRRKQRDRNGNTINDEPEKAPSPAPIFKAPDEVVQSEKPAQSKQVVQAKKDDDVKTGEKPVQSKQAAPAKKEADVTPEEKIVKNGDQTISPVDEPSKEP